MRLSLFLPFAALATGCASSPPLYRPITAAVATEMQPLAVQTRSGERVVLEGVHVVRDSLVGREAEGNRERRFATTDIASITRTEPTLSAGAQHILVPFLGGFLLPISVFMLKVIVP